MTAAGSLAPAFGTVQMALDGDGPGRVTSLSQLEQLPATLLASIEGFDQFAQFENLSFADIVAALRDFKDFLIDVARFSFLDADLPPIGVSVCDVVNFADRFATTMDALAADPAGSLQQLETKTDSLDADTWRVVFDSPVFAQFAHFRNDSHACNRALDGMQPLKRQVPPSRSSASTNVTCMPRSAARNAAE